MTGVVMRSKAAMLARVLATYVVAVVVAGAWLAIGPATGHVWLDSLVADVLATLVVFAASRLHANSSFYDAYWSVAPPLLVLYWWTQRTDGVDATRVVLLAVVVLVWAVRLTGHWARTYPGPPHEDWRYALLRARAPRLAVPIDLVAIHLVPTLQVFVALLPAYVAVAVGTRGLGWLDAVALVVGLGAVTLELVADAQLERFVRRKRPGELLDSGLWGWSRHPNYVGELGVWVAIALFGVAADPGQGWWLWIGAALMLAMFLGASIPMMEERSLQRRPGYQAVIDEVPRFVPWRPRRRR